MVTDSELKPVTFSCSFDSCRRMGVNNQPTIYFYFGLRGATSATGFCIHVCACK